MSSELRFDGRVAVVTGGGRGLGREHALFLAGRGAQVVVNNRSPEPAHEVVELITAAGGTAVASVGDVSRRADANAAVQTAVDSFGRVDILVNNAGTLHLHPFPEFPEADLDDLLDVHFKGAWYATQAASGPRGARGSPSASSSETSRTRAANVSARGAHSGSSRSTCG